MAKKKQIVDVAVILSDASPIITLHRLGRLDVLGLFNVPIHIVDQVHWEITKLQNDPNGVIADVLGRMGNQIHIIETFTGLGFQAKRTIDPNTPSRDLGEYAVNEYAMRLARSGGPNFVPLVFYEDPDMLNTTAFLTALHQAGALPEGLDLVARINALRKTPMRPTDEPARTKKIRSTWIRKSSRNDG
jgi:hypothetical protein